MVTQELLDSAVYAHGVQYLQVHPTFLYEQFFNLLLMVFLLIYRPYKKFAGEMILLYMLGYGIIRFFLESLRTDQLPFFGTGLAASQVMSVVFVAVAIVLLLVGHMHRPTKMRSKK
jgi:phosphatidylglycerol:prolipoprotein diacylglycerol transferase